MDEKMKQKLEEMKQKARKRHLEKQRSNTNEEYEKIKDNIDKITEKINTLSEISFKDKISKKGTEYKCRRIEVFDRDQLNDILGSEIFPKIESDDISSNKRNNLSNIISRINNTLKKHNRRVGTINHNANEYKFLIDIDNEYFKQ